MSYCTLMLQYVFLKNKNTLLYNNCTTIKTRKLYNATMQSIQILLIVPIMSFLRSRIQSRMAHCIYLPYLFSLLTWSGSSDFSLFHELDMFDVSKQVTLENIFHFGFVSCFLMIRFRFCIFGWNISEMMLVHFNA